MVRNNLIQMFNFKESLSINSTLKGWVLYDGDCPFCIALIRRITPLLSHYHFETVPLQTEGIQEELNLSDQDELLKELRVLTSDHRVFGGAEAILLLLSQTKWGYPFYLLSFLPGVKLLLSGLYQWIANRRHCHNQKC